MGEPQQCVMTDDRQQLSLIVSYNCANTELHMNQQTLADFKLNGRADTAPIRRLGFSPQVLQSYVEVFLGRTLLPELHLSLGYLIATKCLKA